MSECRAGVTYKPVLNTVLYSLMKYFGYKVLMLPEMYHQAFPIFNIFIFTRYYKMDNYILLSNMCCYRRDTSFCFCINLMFQPEEKKI